MENVGQRRPKVLTHFGQTSMALSLSGLKPDA